MSESAELKEVFSWDRKTLFCFLELRFFYTKYTVTMKMKRKFFKEIASCSLISNKIKMIKATTIAVSSRVIPCMLQRKISNDF